MRGLRSVLGMHSYQQGALPTPCLPALRRWRPRQTAYSHTFIPGPEVSDFQSVVAKLQEDLLYKLPMRYYGFLHQSRLSTRDLASTEQYEISSEHAPVTTKKIESDYTMYGCLREREIPLVRLMSGPVHQPLVVMLHTVPYPWSDRHPYMALSYAWGSLEETRQIFVG
jgi:hypothetical protein